jgi:uncharacterized membrane protein
VLKQEGNAVTLASPTHHSAPGGDQLSDVLRHRSSQINLGATERWLSILAAGALAGYGLRRRSPAGGAAAMAAAALLHRGATGHCNVYQALGVNRAKGTGRFADVGSDTRARLGGRAGTIVDESITIRRPAADVYAFWRQLENLPSVFSHLASVTVNADGTSRWVAKGPAGVPVQWDARVINDIDNRLIAWQSLEGSTVATAGSVNFTDTGLNTFVHVRLQYDPPAGRIGAQIASWLGDDPAATIRDDLRRLKVRMETNTELSAPRYSPSPPPA